MRCKRTICLFLTALLLLGMLPTSASALTLRKGEQTVTGFHLGNVSEMMLSGGGRMVQTDEGLYFLAEADDRVYLTDGEKTTLVVDEPACWLNYIDGSLYYAT